MAGSIECSSHLPKINIAEIWRRANPEQYQQELQESERRWNLIIIKSIETGGFSIADVLDAENTTYNQLGQSQQELERVGGY